MHARMRCVKLGVAENGGLSLGVTHSLHTRAASTSNDGRDSDRMSITSEALAHTMPDESSALHIEPSVAHVKAATSRHAHVLTMRVISGNKVNKHRGDNLFSRVSQRAEPLDHTKQRTSGRAVSALAQLPMLGWTWLAIVARFGRIHDSKRMSIVGLAVQLWCNFGREKFVCTWVWERSCPTI